MRLSTGYEVRRARIEMVPLMDVVFLLLTFFIYAMLSMSVYRGVHISLPSASGATQSVESFPFVITLTRNNTLLVENDHVNMETAVRRALDRAPATGRRVLIYGDREADLGIAVELLSRLKVAGMEAVSFLVKDTSKWAEGYRE